MDIFMLKVAAVVAVTVKVPVKMAVAKIKDPAVTRRARAAVAVTNPLLIPCRVPSRVQTGPHLSMPGISL